MTLGLKQFDKPFLKELECNAVKTCCYKDGRFVEIGGVLYAAWAAVRVS